MRDIKHDDLNHPSTNASPAESSFANLVLPPSILNASSLTHPHLNYEMIDPATTKNLEIYQRNYLFGLLKQLTTAYPVTTVALGIPNTRFFAHRYIRLNPSRSPNIDTYGDGFAALLHDAPELNSDESRKGCALGSLAAIDWLWHQRWQNPKPIQLPRGSLKLWDSTATNTGVEATNPALFVDESILECVRIVAAGGEVCMILD